MASVRRSRRPSPRILPSRFALMCAVAALCFGVAGCAQKQEVAMDDWRPDFGIEGLQDLEKFDRALEAEGPEAANAMSLTPAEEAALTFETEVTYPDHEYSRLLITRQFLFLHRERTTSVQGWLRRGEGYLPHARRIFQRRGLPLELTYLPFIESGYNPRAVSHAGAAGPWQFIPSTGRNHGLACDKYIDERRDHLKAAEAAASYLSKLHRMFNDWTLALAAYNAGEGKIQRIIDITGAKNFFEIAAQNESIPEDKRLRKETMHYVPRFLAMVKIAENAAALGYTPVRENRALACNAVTVPADVDLRHMAKEMGIPWSEFREMNPAILRDQSPPNRSCVVYVPRAEQNACVAYLKGNPKRASQPETGVYVVTRGDTYSKIAARYGVSTSALMKLNKATTPILRIGQRLRTPAKPGASSAVARAAASPNASEGAPTIPDKGLNVYRVQPRDTLYSLAKQFDVSLKALMEANGLAKPQSLRAGQLLVLPGAAKQQAVAAAPTPVKQAAPAAAPKTETASSAASYTVTPGDTIWSIARKFQLSPLDILAWNQLDRDATLRPGDTLTLRLN